jgi:hypothetical protein
VNDDGGSPLVRSEASTSAPQEERIPERGNFARVARLARLGATRLGRWPIALACVVAIAAVALLPGLGDAGLWEPQERQLADRVAPRRDVMKVMELEAPVRAAVGAALAPKPPNAPPPPVVDDSCPRQPPPDAVARSLTNRAMQWGRDAFGESDTGRRLPLALLALLGVVATAGIAMRTAGPRAGVITALVMLAMPLCALQARQLTSEIGTASGGALIIYGLLALGPGRGAILWRVADAASALAALAGGLAIAFASGGALLGLLVPIGAFAAAGALGAPLLVSLVRGKPLDAETTPVDQIKALVAAVVAIVLVAWLAHQLYDLIAVEDLEPGRLVPTREVLGRAIVPSKCWSSALGAIWKPEDDLRYIYDSTFEQIAYGTYPWGVLAPIAIAALLAAKDRSRRVLGALALAWAGGAWIAGEAFQRRVGFTLYAGFPALALAVGPWLDGVLAGRARGDRSAMPGGAAMIGVFVLLAVLDLGKDLQSFSERLTSITVGGDSVPYPPSTHLAWLPTKLWVLVLGMIVALGFAETMIVWRDPGDGGDDARGRKRRRAANVGAAVALAGTAVVAAFWPYAWHARLATHLSSKAMFDTYLDLRGPGDELVMMGDLGDAPYDYAPDAKPKLVTTREEIVAALAKQTRVFAISPQTELCQLHRELAGKPYFLIDDRNMRSILLSNKVDGTTDKNPLATQILHAEPKDIPHRPKARVVYDSRIELLGWDIPKSVSRGSRFHVTVYYKVLQAVPGNWKVLMHFDGGLRFNGDHDPIGGRCQTSTWQQGDYIVDSYTVIAGGGTFQKQTYEVWTGFFTGAAPNWKNMPVTEAPGDMRDTADRVKITTIDLD